MDWETFYYEFWMENHPDEIPTFDDYLDWLYDKADLAIGEE